LGIGVVLISASAITLILGCGASSTPLLRLWKPSDPNSKKLFLAAAFKDFFTRFATFPVPTAATTSIMLNMYVLQNKEVDMYPMKYILLGRDLPLNSLEVLLELSG
jgi:hypothetical protein